MAYTTINKSSIHMNNKIYTGNGSSSHGITGVGFKPDWTWIKSRSNTTDHILTDIVRGVTVSIKSNTSAGNATDSNHLKSFNSDGFTLGAENDVNGNSRTYASWNWKAGGSQGSANTAGSINTTYTSVNTTAGFSISQYTGTGSNATVGHGLGSGNIPKMIIVKKLNGADSWTIYHASLGATKKINFDTGAAGTQSDRWNDTSPTDTLFSIGTNGSVNANNATYVAYCFADVKGYSKMGGYSGNNNVNGTFVYTGFKPTFVMFKSTASSESWQIYDVKRNPANALGEYLNPNNNSAAGNNSNFVDYLSNGFKLRTADGGVNSSQLYVYMAFGQSLVGTNNIPCTAR